MPIYFIPNKGQVAAQVDYYVQGKDKTIYFTSEGLTYVLSERSAEEQTAEKTASEKERLLINPAERKLRSRRDQRRFAVKLDFVGANADVRPSGEEKTGAVISYFKGKPDEWKAGLPTYSRIVYKNLWPGIDVAYYGTVDKMKYEFVVYPGSDPSLIRLAYRGVSAVEVNGEGRLEVRTPAGDFEDDRPVGYQEIDGDRVDVALKYLLGEQSVIKPGPSGEEAVTKSYVYGFDVGAYDRTKQLVLDPAVLVYCGYIGGSDDDCPSGIAVDGSGNAYVTGRTDSNEATFPVSVGPDLTFNGGSKEGFVAKVNSTGTALLYCGYIGGSGGDYSYGIAVDSSGNAYVTGQTDSNEATFPVTIGPDLTHNGGYWDAFVAKVDSTGTALLYCGYIGGSDFDLGSGIAVDGFGNAYVIGNTKSTQATFPVSVGPDLTFNGSDWDVFVAKVDSTGTTLFYCGYIGGSDDDYGCGIAVDSSGNAYVIGHTNSTQATFPVTVGPDLTYNGGAWDAFVAKVNSTGTALLYCGYIGGSGGDWGSGGIAVDSSGDAYVMGSTSSTQATFPVTVGPDLTFNGSDWDDVFVAKISVSGFTISSSPTSATVTAGQSAAYAVQVTPQYGPFNSSVSFSCTGLPSNCMASFSPTSVTPGANVVTTTLTLATQAVSGSAVGAMFGSTGFIPPTLGLLLAILALLRWLSIRKPVSRKFSCRWLTASALICVIALLASCGTGGGDNPPPNNGTPPGTYQISVQGESGSMKASTTVTLVVR
ncbi:MAG: SBBP repeat-containing protein [Candidatus Atribacteria bacterium]|nr:SBBP repeat-containing protein [Candidatus Atribacteria bacterium]